MFGYWQLNGSVQHTGKLCLDGEKLKITGFRPYGRVLQILPWYLVRPSQAHKLSCPTLRSTCKDSHFNLMPWIPINKENVLHRSLRSSTMLEVLHVRLPIPYSLTSLLSSQCSTTEKHSSVLMNLNISLYRGHNINLKEKIYTIFLLWHRLKKVKPGFVFIYFFFSWPMLSGIIIFFLNPLLLGYYFMPYWF